LPGGPAYIYVQVADDLEARIRAGEFRLAGQLPARGAIAAEYGVGEVTARRAVRELAARGAVVMLPSKGAFVVEPGHG
jgi:DNA-binding GntR family transcriptional regulator